MTFERMPTSDFELTVKRVVSLVELAKAFCMKKPHDDCISKLSLFLLDCETHLLCDLQAKCKNSRVLRFKCTSKRTRWSELIECPHYGVSCNDVVALTCKAPEINFPISQSNAVCESIFSTSE